MQSSNDTLKNLKRNFVIKVLVSYLPRLFIPYGFKIVYERILREYENVHREYIRINTYISSCNNCNIPRYSVHRRHNRRCTAVSSRKIIRDNLRINFSRAARIKSDLMKRDGAESWLVIFNNWLRNTRGASNSSSRNAIIRRETSLALVAAFGT